MSTGERDCRHLCCGDRGNPFHDHFLDPDQCPGCAREREASGDPEDQRCTVKDDK